MAGHISHSKHKQIIKPTSAGGKACLGDDQIDEIRQGPVDRPQKVEIFSHQSDSLQSDSTIPLYNSRIINTYVEYLEKYFPQVEIDTILRQAGITRHEVEDPGHWFSQRQTDCFHKSLAAASGRSDIAREVGRFTSSSERVGAVKQYALGAISLASIYMKIGKLAAEMSRGAEISSKKLAPNKVEIVSRPTPGTFEKPYQCENRIGAFEGLGKLFTKKFTQVEHLTCTHKGDNCCRYILTWENTAALIWKRVGSFALPAALLTWLVCLPFIADQTAAALGGASAA